MKYIKINVPQINVSYFETQLTTSLQNNFLIIQSHWKKFNTLLRINEIKFDSEWEKFGITIKTENQYFYRCAFYSESRIPQFEHSHIPAGSYAKFTHTGPLYSLSKTINQIYKTIIPSSPLDIDLNRLVIHYERYDSRFNWNNQNSIIEIYVQLQN
jgi:predicted transcriptional regulator YdeE